MGKELKHKQFLQMWYNRCGFRNKIVEAHMEEIYEGLLTTIQEEVRLNGSVRLKNLGKFYLLETGGFERKGTDGTKYFIPPHYAPKFTASQNFKDYVNDAIVSKEGRRNKKRGTLTVRETVDILLQLTDGMAAAHDSYIIHRDIKPQNIMILEMG